MSSPKRIPSPKGGLQVNKSGRAFVELVAALNREFARGDHEREPGRDPDPAEDEQSHPNSATDHGSSHTS